MNDVLNYLLDHSHQIPNGMIVDCLKLAQLNPDPDQRLSVAVLKQHLGTRSNVEVSRRLTRLHRVGLIHYEKGQHNMPGYRFLRVGPEQ
jgi:predicted transcriptional regulator